MISRWRWCRIFMNPYYFVFTSWCYSVIERILDWLFLCFSGLVLVTPWFHEIFFLTWFSSIFWVVPNCRTRSSTLVLGLWFYQERVTFYSNAEMKIAAKEAAELIRLNKIISEASTSDIWKSKLGIPTELTSASNLFVEAIFALPTRWNMKLS